MTYKIGACVLIIIFSYLGGYLYTWRFTGRGALLKEIRDRFNIMEREILFSRNSLPDICDEIGQEADGKIPAKIFARTAMGMSHDKHSFCEAWETACRENLKESFLVREQIQILASMGKGLGEGDIEDHRKCFSRINDDLDELIAAADEERARLKKMYMSLFVSGGLCLSIALI